MTADMALAAGINDWKPVILTVDDDPNNLAVVRDCLVECNYTILAAEDGESAIKRADYARPDLILLDVMMPGIDGFETCRRLKQQESTREIPVIFMTALAETGHKVKGLEAGAVDYITKPFQREELLARIAVHLHNRELTKKLKEAKETLERRVDERTLDLAVANNELEEEIAERQVAQEQLQAQTLILEKNIEELQQTQLELQNSERKFRVVFEQTFQLMAVLTPAGMVLEANQTALNSAGLSEKVIGVLFWDAPWWMHSELLREKVREGVVKAAAGELVRFEATCAAGESTPSYIDFSLKPVFDERGSVSRLIAEGRDITALKQMERELRQSQKMEAIGTLAGGIAHDFNNILTAIIGYTDMAHRKLSENESVQRDLEHVQQAGARAKDLVSRILTFSRQGEQEQKPVQVASIIEEALKLLRSTLPTSIEIHQHFSAASEKATVLADSTQLHQVMMNLGTNAAHAMRVNGGILSISLMAVDLDDTSLSSGLELKPGAYIQLTVTDTGHGMEAAIRERIFDPYFTTKKVGEGTGMGLSVVQGIVKNHGGTISVLSEPGKGTTFQLLLPVIEGATVQSAPPVEALCGGSERILFVDDERMLVELGASQLSELGYHITTSTNSVNALELFKSAPHSFDLVITDLTMPGLTGRELARELLAVRPDIPVILCTGFTDQASELDDAGIRECVMKPYKVKSLNQSIRRAVAAG